MKQKTKADEALPITPSESIPADAPHAGSTITLIDFALQQYDPIAAGLQALRDKYATVRINDVNDAAGFELAKSGVRELTSTRTRLEAKRKELKADSLEYGRRIDAKAKDIQAAIEAIEKPLREEVARIEAEKEVIRRAEENRRIRILNTAGFQMVGERYQVGGVGDYFDNIMRMDAQAFEGFSHQGALERERLNKEEAERKRQLAEFEAKQKEMAELEARLAAMKAQLEPPIPPISAPKQVDSFQAPQQSQPSPLPMGSFSHYGDKVLGTNYGGQNSNRYQISGSYAQASINGPDIWDIDDRPSPVPSAAAGATAIPDDHNPGAKQRWFYDGWEACKNRIIKVFTEDQTPRKRAEWVETFRNLQP